jgi:TolB-like protein
LPFANIGGDPEQEPFVDGVTESLTTDLSRIRGSFVIGRNTAFSYKGKAVDLKQIGRELNVRYLLEGSVQHGGNRMRVNVQLIDAETGNHLWAERFDKLLADLFDMQDEIVARLAGALNTELVAAEARRAELAPNPSSMDFYFQGMARFNKGITPDNIAQARSFFDRALSADPGNVDALVWSARTDSIAGGLFFVTDPAAAFAAAEAKLTKALSWVRIMRVRICIWRMSTYSPSAHQRASPNVNMRWRWTEISPAPTPLLELVRFSSVAPKKQRPTLARLCASVRATLWLTPG